MQSRYTNLLVARCLVARYWSLASDLATQFTRLDRLNEHGADVYFGVNPRTRRSGIKGAIDRCQVLWADLDDVDPNRLEHRLRNVPQPTVVVASGHGAHLYWKLKEPEVIASIDQRERFESTLRCFCRDIGGDSTHDVTRILRLPGFMNLKRKPVQCHVTSIDGAVSYSLEDFTRWSDEETMSLSAETISSKIVTSSLKVAPDCDVVNEGRIRSLIGFLDRPVSDRSRRDFGIVCHLLRLGLSPGTIAVLVTGRSKFTSENYTEVTIANALRKIHGR